MVYFAGRAEFVNFDDAVVAAVDVFLLVFLLEL